MYIRKIYKKYIHHNIEKIKWYLIIILLILIMIINYIKIENHLFLIKKILFNILNIMCISIFSLTKVRKKILLLIYDTKYELKNILWPNKKDSLKTTIIVIMITILLSLIFWILDNFLMYAVSWIIQLRL